jgi:O-antigen ligase
MKTNTSNFENIAKSPLRWVLVSLVFVTLFFQTTLADPFNSPKLWILIVLASWISGYLISFRSVISSNLAIQRLSVMIILFIIFLLVASVLTDNLYFAFFGETQRRNGFLQYFSLAVIMLATAMFFRDFNVKSLFQVTYIIASISAFYALLQDTGNDFANWVNPYNSIIGTLGNPNFAAAVMAIMGVLIFSSIFIIEQKLRYRLIPALLALLLLFLIYKSNARQGLLSFGLGVGIFLAIFIWSKSRWLGTAVTFIGGIIVFISVLGILQVGPFEKYLYKPSVSIRGHYWNAGIDMWLAHPFFGVGVDRYGAYFKEFRDSSYPLTYGFEITSTNAHNTFIQFFATSGIFVGITYILLNLYVLQRAINGIKSFNGTDQLHMAALFSAWVAFHAQSLVSIDNIGISIWGWILGGAIVGLSISKMEYSDQKETFSKSSINSNKVLQSSISGALVLTSIILVSNLYSGETNSYRSRSKVNLQDATSLSYYKDSQFRVIDTPLIDPTYSLFASVNLVESGFINEGLSEIEKISLKDPRNITALTLLAIINEQLGNLPKAIAYREKIVKLDPWGATNYLALGKYYKQQGNLIQSQVILEKILSFAAANPISQQAKKELAP